MAFFLNAGDGDDNTTRETARGARSTECAIAARNQVKASILSCHQAACTSLPYVALGFNGGRKFELRNELS